MVYQVNKAFILQKTEENVIIFDSRKSLLFTLNETAAFILLGIKQKWSKEEIKKKLSEKFITDGEKLNEDIDECIKDLVKKEVILQKAY